jgi:hypothetical protein
VIDFAVVHVDDDAVGRRQDRPAVGEELSRSPGAPALLVLTSAVVPARRSRTNTSGRLLASPATRFEANDVYATNRPSALTAGAVELSLPCVPASSRLIASYRPVARSSRTASRTYPLPSGNRSVVCESNTTNRPFGLIVPCPLPASAIQRTAGRPAAAS